MTYYDHEKMHWDKWVNAYNNVRKVVDPKEGKYCNKKCADLAAQIVLQYGKVYYYACAIDNYNFDVTQYKSPTAQAAATALQPKLDAAKQALNEALNAFGQSNCSKAAK